MMETAAQSYWHSEYRFFKNWVVDTPANKAYKDFAKRQYHKARRQHDKELIERELDRIHRH